MASKIQTMISGGLEHPQEIVNFIAGKLVNSTGGLFYISDNDWLVEELDTPDRGVQVNEGWAYLRKNASDEMIYPVRVSGGNYEVNIDINASGNPRVDSIVLYVDKGASPNSDISNVAQLIAVKGTPAGSPTAPSDGDIQTEVGADNPFIRLADVDVSNGFTQILDADITDQRTGKDLRFNFEVATPSSDYDVSNKKYSDDNFIDKTKIYFPNGTGYNYTFTATISSDTLIIALKGIDGNDPSSTNPVYIRVGDEVLGVTSAKSVTLTDSDLFSWGLGDLQDNDQQLFIYAINNNGSLEIGASASPNLTSIATNYYDSLGQTGSAGHSNVVMSGTRNATNSCQIVDRIRAKQDSSDDWVSPTTSEILGRPAFETSVLSFDTNWTNLSLGNGTYKGKYQLVGKKVKMTISLGFGTTTSVSGGISLTVPIPLDTSLYVSQKSTVNGGVYAYSGAFTGFLTVTGSQTITPYAMVASGTYTNIGGGQFAAAVPQAWANGHYLSIDCEYFIN